MLKSIPERNPFLKIAVYPERIHLLLFSCYERKCPMETIQIMLL